MIEECRLCTALENEDPLEEADGFTILAANTLKGHSKRIMIVLNAHDSLLDAESDEEWQEVLAAVQYATIALFDYILSNRDEDDKWAIMAPTHASIPDHFHLMATTLDAGEDMDQITDTERIEIRFLARGEQ